jgi:hypothetical protein
MAKRKDAEREAARVLRSQGWSLRRIARKLGVSLASASVWTRGAEPCLSEGLPDDPGREPVLTRRCSQCHRTLPETSFHLSNGRRRRWCKYCRADYIRQRGQLHRDQTRAARELRRTEARRYVLSLLADGCCLDCGLADPVVLEFDHVGTKKSQISTLVHEGYRLPRIKDEIGNCEIVCVNCHRRRTALRARSWRVDPEWRAEWTERPLRCRNLRFIVDHLQSATCLDCAERDPVVLDFDHVGAKRGSVIELAFQEYSIAFLQRQISQCVIRCANCHRRRTIRQQPDHLRHHLLQPP